MPPRRRCASNLPLPPLPLVTSRALWPPPPLRRVDYVLTVSAQGEEFLTVELEQEYNNLRWRGDFTAECACPLLPSPLLLPSFLLQWCWGSRLHAPVRATAGVITSLPFERCGGCGGVSRWGTGGVDDVFMRLTLPTVSRHAPILAAGRALFFL